MSPTTEPGEQQKPPLSVPAGRCRAGVWGLGYIGRSTFEALIGAGIDTVGFDVDPRRVASAAAVLCTGSGSEASAENERILQPDVTVHFIAVPTERHDQPSNEAIADVFARIVAAVAEGRMKPGALIVVESTLAPGTTATVLLPMIEEAGLVVDEDVLVALAPRRDWLTLGEGGLRMLDRVFGAVGPRSAARAWEFLSLMSDQLHEARSHIEAELVKCVENAYRHVDISLANQLTLAFPNVDMVDVLRLAGTKWNMNEYHPSFGTGGYCIPLAGRYLLIGTERPEELSLLSEALATDDAIRTRVVDAIAAAGAVLILGLTYKSEVKVATLSPTLAMARRLRELGVEHAVHDPMYQPDEILTISGSPAPPDLGDAISKAATIVVVTDHEVFRSPEFVDRVANTTRDGVTVLDNYGVLADVKWPTHVRYRRAGHPGWLADTSTRQVTA